MSMKRINCHLTNAEIKALKERSKKSGLTVSELIRRAVDSYLEK
ncbi:MAG: ribbon-helix-helix protein, CopG family [Candidatus Diapherotrites archaeon]|nr:ribbon-helix-helix protein, CopG family [Candidatus Diapherotrites archaeon]